MFFESVLLGLSTGTYCLFSCAPVALPLFIAEESGFADNARRVGLFMAGRLVSYLLTGFLLGAAGAYALGYVPPAFHAVSARVMNFGAGFLLLTAAFAHGFTGLKFCAVARRLFNPGAGAFTAGLFTALSMCPPFFAAAARVFAGNAGDGGALGALYFGGFFLGTSVYFTPLLGVPLISRSMPAIRWVMRMCMGLLGIYFIFVGGLLGSR